MACFAATLLHLASYVSQFIASSPSLFPEGELHTAAAATAVEAHTTRTLSWHHAILHDAVYQHRLLRL
jgi:hypothetical protein